MAQTLLGQMLRRRGVVSDGQLDNALVHQRRSGCRIAEALLQLRMVDEHTLVQVASQEFGIPMVHIGELEVAPAVLKRLPYKVIMRHGVLPLCVVSARGSDRLVVAFPAPDDLSVVDEVAFAAAMRVEPVLAAEDDLDRAIARHCGLLRAEALELPSDVAGPMRLVDGRTIS